MSVKIRTQIQNYILHKEYNIVKHMNGNPKTFYSYVNKQMKQRYEVLPIIVLFTNHPYSDSSLAADLLANHYNLEF